MGSVNLDVIVTISRLPLPGETIRGEQAHKTGLPGGKGANQAVALKRLGSSVLFSGSFGSDSDSEFLKSFLSSEGIDLSLCTQQTCPSGKAFILSLVSGENSIIITAGANEVWSSEQLLKRLEEHWESINVVLLQREIPQHINLEVAKAAYSRRIRVILDVGGDDGAMDMEILKYLDIISPNETELQRITGMPTESDEELLKAANSLISKGSKNVLLKLGARGSMLIQNDGSVTRQTAFPVAKVVDTTGAGDCFTGKFLSNANLNLLRSVCLWNL